MTTSIAPPNGRPLRLLCLPEQHARELREVHRPLPAPGDRGVQSDFEPAGLFLTSDAVRCLFSEGACAGSHVWLPAWCFRDERKPTVE